MEKESSKGILPDLPEAELRPESTAMLVVDMQYHCAHPEYGVGRVAREQGRFAEWREYFEEIEKVIPRIRRLQDVCRESGAEVIFLTVSSFTRNHREIAHRDRKKFLIAPRGSKEAEVLEELQPIEDEIVLNKFTSDAFTSTPLERILVNMGIKDLIITGVNTNYCVETTTRGAGDRGFNAVLVGDCCAGWTRNQHAAALKILDNAYCKVRSMEEVIRKMKAFLDGKG